MKLNAGVLIVEILIPGCRSLKEKRSVIKPILTRARNKFNVSSAEIEKLDIHHQSTLAFSSVSNEHVRTNKVFQSLIEWLENSHFQIQIIDEEINWF